MSSSLNTLSARAHPPEGRRSDNLDGIAHEPLQSGSPVSDALDGSTDKLSQIQNLSPAGGLMLSSWTQNRQALLQKREILDLGQASQPKPFLTESEDDPILIDNGKKVELSIAPTARAFAAEHQISYSTQQAAFFQFSHAAGIWVRLTHDEAVRQCSDFIKLIANERDAKSLLSKRKESLMKSVLALLKGSAVLGPPPDPGQKLVAVKNGVLKLSGSQPELLPHSKDYNFTSLIPFDYQPKATCPRFLAELLQPALPDPEDMSLLQRALGRMLIAGNLSHRIVLLIGDGGSGKSVLVSLIESILGWEQFAHLRTDKLSERFETHAFHGKSILLGKDVGPDYLSNTSARNLKHLTGYDRTETEQKYGGKSMIVGCFYIIITSNHTLLVVGDENPRPWARRLLPFNFTRETPARIINNFDQVLLREEGAGILAWLVEGCMAHQQELQEEGDFVLTATQQKRIDDLVLQSQSAEHFVSQRIVVGKGSLTTEEIFDAYEDYCSERGWIPASEQKFLTALPSLMKKHHRVNKRHDVVKHSRQQKGFKAVCLVTDPAPGSSAMTLKPEDVPPP